MTQFHFIASLSPNTSSMALLVSLNFSSETKTGIFLISKNVLMPIIQRFLSFQKTKNIWEG